MPGDRDETPFIGEALLHPVALTSICVLLINDHFLKARYPGFITGKLSDIAGLVFFPLLLLSLYDASRRLASGQSGCTRRALIVCIVATGLVFFTVKTTDFGAEAFRRSWAAMQWPAHTVRTHRIDPIGRVRLVKDATDLFALPMLLVAYWVGRKTTG